MEPVTIPKHIDDPVTLLIWSADEFAPAAFLLILGILIGQVTIMLVLAVIAIKAYRRFRDNRPDGFPLHAAYWIGLLPSKAITIPNPFIRAFYP
jgi:conjugal transfer pilus assembly protein TraL